MERGLWKEGRRMCGNRPTNLIQCVNNKFRKNRSAGPAGRLPFEKTK